MKDRQAPDGTAGVGASHAISIPLRFISMCGCRRIQTKNKEAVREQAPDGLFIFVCAWLFVYKKVHPHALTVDIVFLIITVRISGNIFTFILIKFL